MSDLIDRQAAIDAMYKILHDYFWANDEELDAIIATLNDLPSAQPDNRLSKIADLVEGTIDHFDLDDAMDLLYQIKDVLDGSDELPSAQPEIIRCENCTKCQIDTVFHDYWCDGRKVWKDHYCGYAERRTDEND